MQNSEESSNGSQNNSFQYFKERLNTVVNLKIKSKSNYYINFSFKYIRIIGNGTFGVIALAEDIKTGTLFAIKRVFQDFNYINRELYIMREIDNPNIVQLFGHFYSEMIDSNGKTTEYIFYALDDFIGTTEPIDRKVYLHLIMEYVPYSFDSKDLKLTDSCIRSIFAGALFGLYYLHSNDICHRDIKPSNILLTSYYTTKICDFGNAKKLQHGIKNCGYICSRYYRAPENIIGRTVYDHSIDVWAIGCVFAEVVLKFPLFQGKSNNDQLFKIITICGINKEESLYYGIDTVQGIGLYNFLYHNNVDPLLIDVIVNCLQLIPHKRKKVEDLLNMKYFNPHLCKS
ncbi:CMGC/GSK protein kinase [Edhazardia aedis USNM 41457]|uniref:CMGC/GSK protein kinase n=1 Tax=Edhazardia aedis (strain USNM 41457) TaxID=1003232 RepID=J9D2G7_EDHAE|nr:CMGC/GSK protein kinase [Edhazardia aedis USNM 41457]|eukprot:EJW02026.1 CMGC/GSK protein kinase [Edhazardia aedis USNM 41457]